MRLATAALLLLTICLASTEGRTDPVPFRIPYQGSLELDGAPVSSSTQLRFAIFSSEAGATPLWGPHSTTVNAVDGRYHVVLGGAWGGALPLSVSTSPELWLEVSVGDAAVVLTPRQRIFAPTVSIYDGAPPGSVMAFAGVFSNIPRGWLPCNGAAVSADVYPSLATTIGTAFGDGGDAGGHLFNLPDLRGEFLRGQGGTTLGEHLTWSTAMPEITLSTISSHDHGGTTSAESGHTHSYNDPTTGGHNGVYLLGNLGQNVADTPVIISTSGSAGAHSHNYNLAPGHNHTISGGDSETRPDNAAVNWIIKY